MLMIQAESQLEEGYDKDGKTIIANCDTYVYMGSNDVSSAQAIAERLDIPLQKVMHMPVGMSYVFRRGEKPVYCKNYNAEDLIMSIASERKEKKKCLDQYRYKDVVTNRRMQSNIEKHNEGMPDYSDEPEFMWIDQTDKAHERKSGVTEDEIDRIVEILVKKE